MSTGEQIIDRIKRMELYFDTICQAINTGVGVYDDPLLKALLDSLISYYTNGQWCSDFEADERGEIPTDLKRGILSEDGIYNMLIMLKNERED